MKSKYISLLILLMLATAISCRKYDNYNEPVSTDKTKPELVTNVTVINFNGGAYIKYSLPTSGNVLYVMADYKINDKTSRQTKSSYYSDTVMVEGFAKSQEYEVTLHTVSRANVMSDPLVVKVHPTTPPYLLVRPSLALAPDFGGVNVTAINGLKKAIGVILLAFDTASNSMQIQDQHYANIDTINYTVRGFAPVPRKFGVYVTDQYGNVSDTLIQTITPIFETILDKSKFFPYVLSSDSPIGYGWILNNLWDGKTDDNSAGWHTNPGGIQPMVCTFGLGVTAKLSRFVLWERPGTFTYGHGNPKKFSLWGSDKASPVNAQLPKTAAVGTVIGDWTNLGNYNYPDPPSGFSPTLAATNAADQAFVLAGVNFNVPLTSPASRFLRICVSETWSGGDFAHIMEISLYGKP